jgi:hypothetical protein
MRGKSGEEMRAADRLNDDLYAKVRHASEVHRQVRHYAQRYNTYVYLCIIKILTTCMI